LTPQKSNFPLATYMHSNHPIPNNFPTAHFQQYEKNIFFHLNDNKRAIVMLFMLFVSIQQRLIKRKKQQQSKNGMKKFIKCQ